MSRGLVCPGIGQPFEVQSVNSPEPILGSVVIKVMATAISSTSKDIFSGKLSYLRFPTPLIPGSTGVGRVIAAGPDAASLQAGQLVLVEAFVRSRDDPNVQMLFGLAGNFGEKSMKLMEEVWRDAMWAEYARVPLENCYALDEKALLGSPTDGGLGYTAADIPYLTRQLVSYGGYRSIGIQAGETVIVAPATGTFGGAAVEVASAMGAQVIAAGRNLETLQRIAKSVPRVKTVQLSGDVEKDAEALQQFGQPDAFIDFCPGAVTNPTHIKSCLMALKSYGRVALMGGITGDISIPYFLVLSKNITIRGQFMYEREDVRNIIKLVETGLLKLGKGAGIETIGQFPLEDWENGLETAATNPEWGKQVVFTP